MAAWRCRLRCNNKYRNSLARYHLPSYNEWYKAAYYNPINSTYYDYANGSNTAPTAVASGTAHGTAVYNQSVPADVNIAGGLSPYGVMGLNGNASEWQEDSSDLTNSNVSSQRINRGGRFSNTNANDLRSMARFASNPNAEIGSSGFRVAIAPSPGPLPLLGAAAGYGWSRQLRKRIKLASSPTSASKPS
jgi:formylglycine-generating enzyme required for sulfatase activity